MLLKEQTPNQLRVIRDVVYDLLVNCLPPETIIKYLLQDLLKKVPEEIQVDLIQWAAYHENKVFLWNQMRMGSKPIFHIEALLARFMFIYKNYI